MTRFVLTVSSLLVLLCLWASLGETSPLKCCTNFSPKPLPLIRLNEFSVQDATTTCRLHAIVFTTVKDKKVCADPEAPWVKEAVTYLRLKGKRSESIQGPL